MTEAEVLREAREVFRLAQWERRGYYFSEADGYPNEDLDDDTVACCALGAVLAVFLTNEEALENEAMINPEARLRQAVAERTEYSLISYNDHVATSKQDILDIYDLAIEISEKSESELGEL